MNPHIPANHTELAWWLQNFVRSHAKREHPRIEALVEVNEARGEPSYGVRLRLGAVTDPPTGSPPLALAHAEVAEGRTRFEWCEELARRVRTDARRLASHAATGDPRSA